MAERAPKPVIWLVDTLPTLRACPQDVQDEVGYALYLAQIGEKYADAKPLKGLGPGVLGSDCRSSGRHVSSRLHSSVRRAGVRSSRFPEEVEEGDRDAAIRNRLGAAAAQTSCGLGPEAGALKWPRRRITSS